MKNITTHQDLLYVIGMKWYGSSKKINISKNKIKASLISLGFAVPVIIPLPFMLLLAWCVRKDLFYIKRFEK